MQKQQKQEVGEWGPAKGRGRSTSEALAVEGAAWSSRQQRIFKGIVSVRRNALDKKWRRGNPSFEKNGLRGVGCVVSGGCAGKAWNRRPPLFPGGNSRPVSP